MTLPNHLWGLLNSVWITIIFFWMTHRRTKTYHQIYHQPHGFWNHSHLVSLNENFWSSSGKTQKMNKMNKQQTCQTKRSCNRNQRRQPIMTDVQMLTKLHSLLRNHCQILLVPSPTDKGCLHCLPCTVHLSHAQYMHAATIGEPAITWMSYTRLWAIDGDMIGDMTGMENSWSELSIMI